eukprot:GHVR01022093.1.p1 GENE.GHVR01022093.1~~GHVR01022093.1.p1  ORF type:complete len:390 (-),score=148.77 GHVR01022093.1:1007-2176(-)
MSQKKLINVAEKCVDESLEGVVRTNPGLRLLRGHRVVVRGDIANVRMRGQVALICGGGSGHEPSHAGFVGAGMLSAAVAGMVFASPPASSVLASIRVCGKGNSGGVVVVVKNYTGDRLNFGVAVEKAKAEGIRVEMVVVGEDCALKSVDKTAGRRGLCGCVMVYKMMGAMCEDGSCLNDIVCFAREAVGAIGTIGVSLSACSVPGGQSSFELGEGEMEVGLGIHGETGVKRMSVMTAKETVSVMLNHMTDSSSDTHMNIPKGEDIAVIVNNLGGSSNLEMNIVTKETLDWFNDRGVCVKRVYVGTLMTSLDMRGVSISVLLLNTQRLKLLDTHTDAHHWPNVNTHTSGEVRDESMIYIEEENVKGSNTHTHTHTHTWTNTNKHGDTGMW